MNRFKVAIVLQLLAVCLCFTSCRRTCGDVWEDSKSCGRHVGRGFNTLCGKHCDSRQVVNRDDFCVEPEYDSQVAFNEREFIPLQDEYGNDLVCMTDAAQARETPGDPGSSIPGIEAFMDPANDPRLSPIFQNVLFEYNSNLVKGERNLGIIHNVADYMRSHPNVYVFVEGHCDERGPEAYNLALGARRANTIRNMLVDSGVNPDNVFTISYGKERPLVGGTDESTWSLNRRGQFKVYIR